ncbi:hypothetical protein VNO77_18918 [Canavalia gladiata]|uniref:Uncharacterized protein n=1 Tax=Canavalia gladiata TaxID=3824 RepID=A0AAN9QK23_CANGL
MLQDKLGGGRSFIFAAREDMSKRERIHSTHTNDSHAKTIQIRARERCRDHPHQETIKCQKVQAQGQPLIKHLLDATHHRFEPRNTQNPLQILPLSFGALKSPQSNHIIPCELVESRINRSYSSLVVYGRFFWSQGIRSCINRSGLAFLFTSEFSYMFACAIALPKYTLKGIEVNRNEMASNTCMVSYAKEFSIHLIPGR